MRWIVRGLLRGRFHCSDKLGKKPFLSVIARSDFRDEAISKALIFLKTRLLRGACPEQKPRFFATLRMTKRRTRKDDKLSFSTSC